jgi:hypothetical protein
VYAIFADISPDPLGIFATLEEALAKGEELLLEHYPEVYEEAMHWNDSPTIDEERQALNAIMGYKHLD